jgi:hypothetical protein
MIAILSTLVSLLSFRVRSRASLELVAFPWDTALGICYEIETRRTVDFSALGWASKMS